MSSETQPVVRSTGSALTRDRAAVVLPGGLFGPHAPLLMYSADAPGAVVPGFGPSRGPLARSAEVLGQVATAVERFLDDVVWPQRHRSAGDS